MQKFRRWLLRAIAECDKLYSHPDPHEGVWLRSAAIVHEAGDRAAEVGLTEIYERSLKFEAYLEPERAKAFVADCVDAIDRRTESRDDAMRMPEAAKYIGYTVRGLRKLVASGAIRYSQRKKGAKITFRREWLDEFLAAKASGKRAIGRPSRRRFPARAAHGLDPDLLR